MLYRFPFSSTRTVRFAHCLVIVLTAAVLCLPFLLIGIPVGNDAITHMMYQYYFSHQFWAGDLYPRWLAGANKGYGSPIFLVQYPLPYFITALLRPILSLPATATRESRDLGVYCFLMLAAAGLSARLWFRERCTPVASTIAALVYISFPYLIGQVLYMRVAIGELTTYVWMPLMLTFCDRVNRMRFGMVSAIGVTFALLVFSNILYAALFIPVILLYAAVSGKRTVLSVLLALLMGTCVAAVYLFPLVADQRFFDPSAFVTLHKYGELGRSLLYVSFSEVHNHRIAIPGIVLSACATLLVARYIWHASVGVAARLGMLLTLALGAVLLIPGVGPALIAHSSLKTSGFGSFAAYSMKVLFVNLFTIGLAFLSYCRISGTQSETIKDRILLVVCCGAFFLMLAWSASIWKVLPGTAIIQFPWRISAILSVAAAGLFATAIEDSLRRDARGEKRPSLAVMILFALGIIVAGSVIWRVDLKIRSMRTPAVDVRRFVDPMYVTYVPRAKIGSFAKLEGTSPGSFVIAPTKVEKGVNAEFLSGKGKVSVAREGPRTLVVSEQSKESAQVQIGQLYFPLWRLVSAKGSSPGAALGSSADDLIEVSLTPGKHKFTLIFGGGLPEKAGLIVTVISILFVVGQLVFAGLLRRRRALECLSARKS